MTALKKGTSYKNTFRTKSGKINRIGYLESQIENNEREVACAECQNIIVHLYLTEAALPFYKLDKLTFYNAALNMYG